MCHMLWKQLVGCVGVASCALSVGCKGDDRPNDEAAGGSGGEAGAPVQEPPEAADEGLPCVIGADCPAGQHCDLGECVQSCSVDDPCASGTSCSARARCLELDEPDTDPPPETEFVGTVSASPTTAQLTQDDSNLTVALNSDSTEPVRYRVEIDAPHLSIEEPRGEFIGSTTLEFSVDPVGVVTRDAPGTVRIITTLGTILVTAPLHAGIAGRYHGALRYDNDLVNLGEARIAVDITDVGGDVDIRMDPSASLLFPETAAGAAAGFGSYTAGETINLTVRQRIDRDFGGERNHFRNRDLGRELVLHLEPDGRGNLRGTFTEQVIGILEDSVILTGDVRLEHQPDESDPDIVSDFVELPSAPANGLSFAEASDVFTFWTGDCASEVAVGRAETYNSQAQRLVSALSQTGTNFEDIAADCEAALQLAGTAVAATPLCGNVPPLACVLNDIADGNSADAATVGDFGLFMQALAAPAALVAQEEMVQALLDSFSGAGTSAELSRYETAVAALSPVATWMLQPRVLTFMKYMDRVAAAEPPEPPEAFDADSTQADAHPALRALARVLVLLAEADGERSRVSALRSSSVQAEQVVESQTRALLTYLEAVALYGVLVNPDQPEQTPPENVVAPLTGILNPLDAGFGALVEGPMAFGVPEGHVPFVYRSTDSASGATNFEQMLNTARSSIAGEELLEEEFRTRAREFDLNQQALADERLRIDEQYDTELLELCGTDFDPDAVAVPQDWEDCGQTDGSVASRRLALEQAYASLQSAESRARGVAQKIEIDLRVLAETQNVHQETMQFITETGQEFLLLTAAEGTLNAIAAAAQTAASSQLFNAGAPAALAAVTYVVEIARTQLTLRREQLQTAQTLRFEEATAEIELINGMGNIQRQYIDLEQLGVESQENLLAVLQAKMDILNEVNRAKRALDLRNARQVLADKNPIGDPAYRIVRDRLALQLLDARARAQRNLYLAGRALEYEINQPIATLGGSVANARHNLDMQVLANCLDSIFHDPDAGYGNTDEYVTTVSVREALGITGPRVDSVTGEELPEGRQFQLYVLRNENLDPDGSVSITFSTNLQPGNGLWSANVCNDRIASVEAQLVGDFLGDNEAEVKVELDGTAAMRPCGSEELNIWELGLGTAVVQAGVNTFGDASPNTSLFGQSVARATWVVTIMGGNIAPSNTDVDLSQLEDIVLRVTHRASPQRSLPSSVDFGCLADVL